MKNAQSTQTLDDAGKLVLRGVLGILLLLHGVSKLTGGIDFITASVTKAGLPSTLAYLVYVGEVLAPLLVLLGIWTRLGAIIIAGNMLFAVALVHTGELLVVSKTGGWALELQAFYFGTAIAVALLGAGRYSAGGSAGRLN
ncbi:DoxX family protein [soil metagenome]